ncbi:MATE family efflux transporter [Natranaerobius thermophilus]|uniref:Probable multidrug resistance protein NorM n=1 Tax=Natranaerobius thermophilus (strain ATCC BAA-1301 / DSM 18059 / JW/NM-WN-LF) TaxID=457570 RepID=B2A0P3_NATTJ|nr:MATE family efflux transporter [Natranaerobius thermophilus]ACB85923.1 MATE efflux family protein [Natranaerobius thermophilus JW/NM-WN-LF]
MEPEEKQSSPGNSLEGRIAPDRENILRNLWKLSWPVMLGMMLHSTLAVADTFFVGRLGDYAVAAISLSGNIFWLLITISEVINVGTVSMVARFIGAEEPGKVKNTILHSGLFALLLSLLVSSLLIYFSAPFLSLFTQDEQILASGTAYLRIMAVGMFILFLYIVMSASFQGAGDTKTPMKMLFFANGLNIILNPVFILGLGPAPRLEVMGAGVATLVSNSLALLILGRWFFRTNKLPAIKVSDFQFNRSIARNIMAIGFPAGVQAISRPLTGMILMYMVSIFGDDAIAAFGVGQRALSYAFIVSAGLMVATTTMVGQGLGTGDLDYTRSISRKSIIIGFLFQGAIALVYFVLARPIMDLFITESQLAVEMGVNYLRIIALGLLFAGPIRAFVGTFKGAGDTVPGMVAAFISNWIVKLSLAYLMAFHMEIGTNGIWWAITISIGIEIAILYYWYQKGTWLYRKIQVQE